MNPMAYLVTLHLLAAIIWVGGMFFAHRSLRPAAAQLEPPQRLGLWVRTFSRFFPWVWVAVIILPATGYAMILGPLGGFARAGMHVHIMHVLGIVMILIFLHIYFAPYRRLRDDVAIEDWPQGTAHLAVIRKLVGWNLLLGLVVAAVAGAGRYL